MRIRQLVQGKYWYPKNEFCFSVFNKDISPNGVAESCYISGDGIEKNTPSYISPSTGDARTIYESNSGSATE